jgi:hypothetical protein
MWHGDARGVVAGGDESYLAVRLPLRTAPAAFDARTAVSEQWLTAVRDATCDVGTWREHEERTAAVTA